MLENVKNSSNASSTRHIDSDSSVENLDENSCDYLEIQESLSSLLKGQEKWSSVRICDSNKNSVKVENHVSIHSNLNLNGLHPKEVKEVIQEKMYRLRGKILSEKNVYNFLLHPLFLLRVSSVSQGLTMFHSLSHSIVHLLPIFMYLELPFPSEHSRE